CRWPRPFAHGGQMGKMGQSKGAHTHCDGGPAIVQVPPSQHGNSTGKGTKMPPPGGMQQVHGHAPSGEPQELHPGQSEQVPRSVPSHASSPSATLFPHTGGIVAMVVVVVVVLVVTDGIPATAPSTRSSTRLSPLAASPVVRQGGRA